MKLPTATFTTLSTSILAVITSASPAVGYDIHSLVARVDALTTQGKALAAKVNEQSNKIEEQSTKIAHLLNQKTGPQVLGNKKLRGLAVSPTSWTYDKDTINGSFEDLATYLNGIANCVTYDDSATPVCKVGSPTVDVLVPGSLTADGDITSTNGDIVSSTGSVSASSSGSVSGGTITATTGDITATTGDIVSSTGSLKTDTIDPINIANAISVSGPGLDLDTLTANSAIKTDTIDPINIANAISVSGPGLDLDTLTANSAIETDTIDPITGGTTPISLSGAGGLNVTEGDVIVYSGNVYAENNITAGEDIISIAGDIIAQSGNVTAAMEVFTDIIDPGLVGKLTVEGDLALDPPP